MMKPNDMWDEEKTLAAKKRHDDIDKGKVDVMVEEMSDSLVKIVRIRRGENGSYYLTKNGCKKKQLGKDITVDETMIWTQDELQMLYTKLMGLEE